MFLVAGGGILLTIANSLNKRIVAIWAVIFPLILVLFSLASLVVTPIALAVQRHFEHEADRFGLEITHDNYAAATAFVKLQQENLGVPRPGRLYTWWRASHPTLGDRIDFSNDYRPWESSQPLVYGDRFKSP